MRKRDGELTQAEFYEALASSEFAMVKVAWDPDEKGYTVQLCGFEKDDLKVNGGTDPVLVTARGWVRSFASLDTVREFLLSGDRAPKACYFSY